MASAKLVFTFGDASGNTFNMSFNYADEDVTSQDVRTAGQAIITNGSIFEKVPSVLKAAKMVVTTETEYNVNAENTSGE